MIFKRDIFSLFTKAFRIDVFLLINNLIEKKMTRRASFNFTDSYIVMLTFSDLKCNLSPMKDTILSPEAKGGFICKYKSELYQ